MMMTPQEIAKRLDRIIADPGTPESTVKFLVELREILFPLWNPLTGRLRRRNSPYAFEQLVQALLSDGEYKGEVIKTKRDAVALASRMQEHEPDWGWRLLKKAKPG